MADDSKRSKLSLPARAADAPSDEVRKRAPLRGSSKPRAPGPGRHRAFDESAPGAERPAREGRPGGDRPRRDGDRPSFGERPRRDGDRPSWGDRPARPSGPRREEDRTPFGDRLPREEFRGGAGRGEERRPAFNRDGERPSRNGDRPQRSAERPSYRDNGEDRRFSPNDKPRFEGAHGSNRPAFGERTKRPAFREGGERRPEGRNFDERRPYGDRPQRDGDRPARPAFRDDNRRPEGRNAEERRPYGERSQREGDRPRYDNDRPATRHEGDRPAFGERPARPAFRDDNRRPAGRSFEERRPSAERPRRDEAPRSYGERPRRDIERDGPAPAPTFGDDQMPAAPRGSSFGRSRAEPRETQTSDAPQAAPSKPHRPAPPESFANRRSADTPADQPGAVRLSKLMAEMGLCSRREADDYIERGWVKVDGEVIDELGSKVLPHQHIELLPVAEEIQLRRITILINKPIGYVSGQAEDGYEPAAVLITPENHWTDDPTRRRFESRVVRKLAPAGRLDIDSTGLLVLTQDGRVAKQLIGETSEVEKEYLVRVEGELSQEGMRLLHHGLELDGVELQPAKVSWQNEDQLRFVLQEGRKRQIRRMCELVGLKVVGLKRIRIGKIPLGKLPLGQWRYLGEHEKF
ncbi:pseudouridine synthase [Uliginosibacterium sp. 31-16]|uniref:pseudouridine synthase n=1 Tax=Uliginosibacterium sp. 31-16 TaxID=3068315 RepID=UPI00273F8B2C|nr:pseudouridine synthase [Uliginosibacterium sp. 31-16]MDP5240709.1 pseudouridine synthase [Uliginosibacterium sp. 31-16]